MDTWDRRSVLMPTDQIDVSVGTARLLGDDQFTEWSYLPLRPLPTAATVNTNFRLGNDLTALAPAQQDGGREVVRGGLCCGDVQWLPESAWVLEQAMRLVWYDADANPACADGSGAALTTCLQRPNWAVSPRAHCRASPRRAGLLCSDR